MREIGNSYELTLLGFWNESKVINFLMVFFYKTEWGCMGLVKSQLGLVELSMGSTFSGAVTRGSFSFFFHLKTFMTLAVETQVPHYRTNIFTELTGMRRLLRKIH